MTKVCIAGKGNMGQAIFDLLSNVEGFEVSAFDSSENPNDFLEDCDLVIIAVKPQSFETLAKSIECDLSGKLIVSIMAGMSVEKITTLLNAKKIVRMMPNLALQVGKSFSGWFCSEEVDEEEKNLIREIIGILGTGIELDSEEKLDLITPLSGSGPAYFCYLSEALEQSAVDAGFTLAEAAEIAGQTLTGTAALLEAKSLSPSELRRNVSSKGGSTEVAIAEFERQGFKGIVCEAVLAAGKRTKELNN